MKKTISILLILLVFTSACSSSASATPSPVPPSPTAQIPTEVHATATVASPAQPSLGTIALDFVALLCDAQWMNGVKHLTACPPANADRSGGYAIVVDPASEGLPANTPVISTVAGTYSAALFLRYPTFKVHAGDHFRATLRCQTNAPCDVEYALEYYDAQGKYHSPVISWNYQAGDPPITVNVDLSALANQSVDFVLTLRPQNNSAPQQNAALWIAPVIYRPNP